MKFTMVAFPNTWHYATELWGGQRDGAPWVSRAGVEGLLTKKWAVGGWAGGGGNLSVGVPEKIENKGLGVGKKNWAGVGGWTPG